MQQYVVITIGGYDFIFSVATHGPFASSLKKKTFMHMFSMIGSTGPSLCVSIWWWCEHTYSALLPFDLNMSYVILKFLGLFLFANQAW